MEKLQISGKIFEKLQIDFPSKMFDSKLGFFYSGNQFCSKMVFVKKKIEKKLKIPLQKKPIFCNFLKFFEISFKKIEFFVQIWQNFRKNVNF